MFHFWFRGFIWCPRINVYSFETQFQILKGQTRCSMDDFWRFFAHFRKDRLIVWKPSIAITKYTKKCKVQSFFNLSKKWRYFPKLFLYQNWRLKNWTEKVPAMTLGCWSKSAGYKPGVYAAKNLGPFFLIAHMQSSKLQMFPRIVSTCIDLFCLVISQSQR